MIQWLRVMDEIIEGTKIIPIKFNEKKQLVNNLHILLAYSLITIALLKAVSIYCYLIKYWAKQKHLLPFHITNKELKEVIYSNNIN